jgi:hypothetical protein
MWNEGNSCFVIVVEASLVFSDGGSAGFNLGISEKNSEVDAPKTFSLKIPT